MYAACPRLLSALPPWPQIAGHKTGFGSPTWLNTHDVASSTAPPVAALLAAGAAHTVCSDPDIPLCCLHSLPLLGPVCLHYDTLHLQHCRHDNKAGPQGRCALLLLLYRCHHFGQDPHVRAGLQPRWEQCSLRHTRQPGSTWQKHRRVKLRLCSE
jgi:hypothetical protein